MIGPQAANALGLLLTTLRNTAVNRSFTFGSRAPAGRAQLQGLAVLALALAVTAAGLHVLHALVADPARWLEVGVLVVANLVATVLRFLLLRRWVFRAAPRPTRMVR